MQAVSAHRADSPAWDHWAIRLSIAVLFFVLSMHVCGAAFGFRAGAAGAPQFLVADDSMITLRVSRAFAHGLGLYFNAGERTAANTSLFWPLLLSPVFRVVADAARAVAVLSILSAACASLTVALTVYFAGSLRCALSSGVTLLLLPGLREYGASVWEHVPQMLLVTVALQVFLGWVPAVAERYRTDVCLLLLGLGFLVRPDTLPVGVAVIAGSLLVRQRWTAWTGAAAGFFALSVLGYFALHHHLYDSFVPNTYSLKVRFGAASVRLGVEYVLRSMQESAIPIVLVALGVLAVWYRRAGLFVAREKIVIGALLLQIAYIVAVGGDVFLFGRFFLFVGPIAVALLWRTVWRAVPEGVGKEPVFAGVTAVTLLAVAASVSSVMAGNALQQTVTFERGIVSGEVQPYADQAVLAEFLRARVTPADGQIGLFALGALSYYMPEYTVADFLGKADPVIAHEPVRWGPIGHNKWDFVHSLRDRHVSVVPFTVVPEEDARRRVAARADFAFADAFQLDPYLRAHYTYRSSEQLGAPGTEGLFIRNDLLSRFPDRSGSLTVR